MRFGESHSYYAASPGSPNICGVKFRRRTGTSADYLQALRVAEDSPAYHMVDDSIVPCDVPQKITGLYILYQMMMEKTLVAEAWEQDSVKRIERLMDALSGSEGRKKPNVLLAACPTPPMRWEKRVIDNGLDCMELGIPLFTCPSPVMGISSPVTIAGAYLLFTLRALACAVVPSVAVLSLLRGCMGVAMGSVRPWWESLQSPMRTKAKGAQSSAITTV